MLFRELKPLGQGNFSKVFKAQHRVDGMCYAVKRSAREVLTDADRLQWCQVPHSRNL